MPLPPSQSPASRFRKPTRKNRLSWANVSPWIISTSFHLLMLVLLLTAWSVGRSIVAADRPVHPIVVPSAFLNPDGGPPGGSLHPGADPVGDAAANMARNPADANWQKANGDLAGLIQNDGGGSAADALARGAAAAGSGRGISGGPAALGTPGGGGLGNGPKVTFFGTGGGGKRIVFILDRSGGMLGEWPGLKVEVTRSLAQMIPIQQAAIVLVGVYKGPGTDEYDPPKLLGDAGQLARMTQEGKAMLAASLPGLPDDRNDGELKPFVDSFEMAFALQPDLIFFLTDGEFDRELIPRVAQLNREAHVRINTLRFGLANNGGEVTKTLEAALEKLAHDNGGVYRYVPEEEALRNPR